MKKVLSLLTTLALTTSTTSTLVGCGNSNGTSEGAIFIKLGDNPSVTIPYQLKDHTLKKSTNSTWNTPGENNLQEIAKQLKSKYKITDDELKFINIKLAKPTTSINNSFDNTYIKDTQKENSGSDFIMRDLSPRLYYNNTNYYKILKIHMTQPKVSDFSKVYLGLNKNGPTNPTPIRIDKNFTFSKWTYALRLSKAKTQIMLGYHNFMSILFKGWSAQYKMPPFFTNKNNWTEAATNPGAIDKTLHKVTFNWVMKSGTTDQKNFKFIFKDN